MREESFDVVATPSFLFHVAVGPHLEEFSRDVVYAIAFS
jgi:hypothetical protein